MPAMPKQVPNRRARLHAAGCTLAAALAVIVAAVGPTKAEPGSAGAGGETVEQAICRLVEGASTAKSIPVGFLTRLIWQESSFRVDVISRAGAQGVAQFMPGTARARGLANPFDPEQAIPAAASFLSELEHRFGNLGLAAAAYNAGPNRVASWLQGQGGLPEETRDYVLRITARSADDWAAAAKQSAPEQNAAPAASQSCLQVTAELRRPGAPRSYGLIASALAPWGVQLSGNFSKSIALTSYNRARDAFASVIGSVQPMIIGTRLASRGSRPFYRVRVPAQSRAEADRICARIHALNGACITLRS